MGTGLYARRATGLTVAESEENFTRTESVVRWSREGRAASEAEREALLFFFFLFRPVHGVPIRQKIISGEGRGFFFFPNFSVSFYVVFAVLLCRCAVLYLFFFRTYSIYIKIIN